MAAVSLDGRLTHADEPGAGFASAEDQELFMAAIRRAHAIIMGRTTFEVARPNMRLPKRAPRQSSTPDVDSGAPSSRRAAHGRHGPTRYVLTSDPGRFSTDAIDGVLEFTNEPPEELLTRIRSSIPPAASNSHQGDRSPGRHDRNGGASDDSRAGVDPRGQIGGSDILVLGGSRVYAGFSAAGLVDEWHITFEPVLFGDGLPLLSRPAMGQLDLVEVRNLNESTLWARYVPRRFSGAQSERILPG